LPLLALKSRSQDRIKLRENMVGGRLLMVARPALFLGEGWRFSERFSVFTVETEVSPSPIETIAILYGSL
jgi:hypothetical protein